MLGKEKWFLTLLLLVWGIPNPEPLSTSPIRKSETLRGRYADVCNKVQSNAVKIAI